MLRVTLDTGARKPAELARIKAAIVGRDIELAHTTVTDREQGTSYASKPAEIVETMVWGESRWGQSKWGSQESTARFEAILRVIGNPFPSQWDRNALSPGRERQLRDAMILSDHTRDARDVFVTTDKTAFVKHGRREQLEALCSTKIMTVDEFLDWIASDDRA